MNEQQMVELAHHVRIHAIFCVIGFSIGLIASGVVWGWLIRVVKRSDADPADRGIGLAVFTTLSLFMAAGMMVGICMNGADMLVPMGSVIRDFSPNKAQVIRLDGKTDVIRVDLNR